MQLYKDFPTLESFYAYWDNLDHTKLTAYDFARRCIVVSTLKNEATDQTLSRLKRAWPPIHSYNKWGPSQSGRYCFDTLRNVLCGLRYLSVAHNKDSNGVFVDNDLAKNFFDGLLRALPHSHMGAGQIKKPDAPNVIVKRRGNRRVFYIDLGDMNKKQATMAMAKIKEQFKLAS